MHCIVFLSAKCGTRKRDTIGSYTFSEWHKTLKRYWSILGVSLNHQEKSPSARFNFKQGSCSVVLIKFYLKFKSMKVKRDLRFPPIPLRLFAC